MKKLIVSVFLFAFLILLLSFRVFALNQDLKIDAPVVDFKLPDLSNKNYSLSQFKGKVVLLNFWATWCPPCKIEVPILQKIYKSYKKFGFEIIAVSLDSDVERLKSFVKENSVDFIVLSDKKGTVGFKYGIEVIPTSFLIDRKQILRKIYYGIIPEKEFILELKKWLKN